MAREFCSTGFWSCFVGENYSLVEERVECREATKSEFRLPYDDHRVGRGHSSATDDFSPWLAPFFIHQTAGKDY